LTILRDFNIRELLKSKDEKLPNFHSSGQLMRSNEKAHLKR
jgi:hypothetical protein